MTSVYLDIAAQILRRERRPLSPRAILAGAYSAGIVPGSLHGKAQHKTLQARISEDIIRKRESSQFFRTSPGRYFLRDFLGDQTIPADFQMPFHARRRLRELTRGPVLAISSSQLSKAVRGESTLPPSEMVNLFTPGGFSYINLRKDRDQHYIVRPFVCVFKGSKMLTYRVGQYRDNRESFLSKRSIGFSAVVNPHDITLFNVSDLGILDAGVRAAAIDLDLAQDAPGLEILIRQAVLCRFVIAPSDHQGGDLLAVVSMSCPTWFEPFRRRLALNDLQWMDIRNRVNNVDDFDPWSKCVLTAMYDGTSIFGRTHNA